MYKPTWCSPIQLGVCLPEDFSPREGGVLKFCVLKGELTRGRELIRKREFIRGIIIVRGGE